MKFLTVLCPSIGWTSIHPNYTSINTLQLGLNVLAHPACAEFTASEPMFAMQMPEFIRK
jgi:hypothetical protein